MYCFCAFIAYRFFPAIIIYAAPQQTVRGRSRARDARSPQSQAPIQIGMTQFGRQHMLFTPVVGIHGCQAPIDIGMISFRREPYSIGKHISRNALLTRLDVGRKMVTALPNIPRRMIIPETFCFCCFTLDKQSYTAKYCLINKEKTRAEQGSR